MSTDAPSPNPSMTDERRRILKEFLDKKVLDIRIENPVDDAIARASKASSEKVHEDTAEPSRIIQANADGSLKPPPEPPKDTINFRAFPDGTFAKFTEIPQRPGFLALCLNTAQAGDPDVLNQVGIVKSRAVADMFCDGINALMQLRMLNQQMAAAQAEAIEEANETAVELQRMDDEGGAQSQPSSVDPAPATSESAS